MTRGHRDPRVIQFPTREAREKRKRNNTPAHRYLCGELLIVCPQGFAIDINDYMDRYILPAMRHASENG